jgi:hypothetical protein
VQISAKLSHDKVRRICRHPLCVLLSLHGQRQVEPGFVSPSFVKELLLDAFRDLGPCSALEFLSIAFFLQIARIMTAMALHFNNTFLQHWQSSEQLYIACSILDLKSRLFFWIVQINFLQCIEFLNHLLRVRSILLKVLSIREEIRLVIESGLKGNCITRPA